MKKILNTIRIVSVAAVLAVGVSYTVQAFTLPNGNQLQEAVSAPIHTGANDQIKGTGNPITGGIFSKQVLAAPVAFFTKSYLPGNDSTLRIGSSNTASNTNTPVFNSGNAPSTLDNNTKIFGTGTIPVTIDMATRGSGSDAIEFITDQACPIATRFVNDKAAAFQFWSTSRNANANLIANQVQLTGGNPAKDYVLLGDADGNARWAKASVVNGQVVFSSGTSPVPAGQCSIPYVPPACPAGQSRDSDGYCKCDNTGLDPIAPPTYPTNRGVQTYNCSATGTCTADIKFQSPPFILKKLRNVNGTPASMPNKCIIATKPVNVCPDGDNFGDEIYTDANGNSYPIWSGTGTEAGKYKVLTGLGETCTESSSATQNGTPYNNYTVSVFP